MPMSPKRSLSPVRRPMLRTKSGESQLPTRGLQKSLSFNGKSLMARGLAFNRKHVRSCNNPGDDEVNLFMSDMVTKEYCIEKLDEVKQRVAIVKMEIEDLLVSRHSSLVPIIKQLVVGSNNTRAWEWIRFTDTADTDDYKIWQSKKHNICQGFELTVPSDRRTNYQNVITFECTIRLSRGTSHADAMEVFQSIQQDESLMKWGFEGSLYNFDDDKKPFMLQQLVDADSGDLLDEVVLNIKCGWNAELSEDSKALLRKCIQHLKNHNEPEPPKKEESPYRRVRSCNVSPSSRPQLPRRKAMRRCISSEDGLPTPRARGVGRTTSMPSQSRGRRSNLSPPPSRKGQRTATDSPTRPKLRRATSPTSKRRLPEEEEETPRLPALNLKTSRGRSSDCRAMTRTSDSSTASTATCSTLSSVEEEGSATDVSGRTPTLPPPSSRPVVQPAGGNRSPPRRIRSFHSTALPKSFDSARASTPRMMPSCTSASRVSAPAGTLPPPSLVTTKRIAPRRTKSLHDSASSLDSATTTISPDFNWSNFAANPTITVTPDYDWKAGNYNITPLTSKAA